MVININCRAGSIMDVSVTSATVKVNTTISPASVQAIYVSSTSVDLSAGGALIAQVTNSGTNGGQVLLKNPTISETPNIASMANPLTGISITNGLTSYCYNRTAMWSFSRNGAGLGYLMGNAITSKDADDTSIPAINNEINNDGIMWIDNRQPDGILGHDVSGRFLRFKVGGNRSLSIGRYGVQIGTYTVAQDGVINSTLTVAGRVESTVGGFKFPDGSIQTTAASSSSNVFTSIVLTPQSTPPTSPVIGTIYIDSNTNQARWWNGSQWLVAW